MEGKKYTLLGFAKLIHELIKANDPCPLQQRVRVNFFDKGGVVEFKCKKCGEVFRPHRFIGHRHPSQARCPKCDGKGKITKQGDAERKDRFLASNQKSLP